MSDLTNHIWIDLERMQLKNFTISNRGPETTIKIEVTTKNGYALSALAQELQEARQRPARNTRSSASGSER